MSPSSYTNTIFNQSACVLSYDCFLKIDSLWKTRTGSKTGRPVGKSNIASHGFLCSQCIFGSNFWLMHSTMLKFYREVDFRGMGLTSSKSVVDVTFFNFCFFFLRFCDISQSDAPIKLKLKNFFSHLLVLILPSAWLLVMQIIIDIHLVQIIDK